jgi:hypothetical protein
LGGQIALPEGVLHPEAEVRETFYESRKETRPSLGAQRGSLQARGSVGGIIRRAATFDLRTRRVRCSGDSAGF